MSETTNTNSSTEAAGLNQRVISNLVLGVVQAGESCFASECCPMKDAAMNGAGCPVADGNTIGKKFSCGAARAFAAFGC